MSETIKEELQFKKSMLKMERAKEEDLYVLVNLLSDAMDKLRNYAEITNSVDLLRPAISIIAGEEFAVDVYWRRTSQKANDMEKELKILTGETNE